MDPAEIQCDIPDVTTFDGVIDGDSSDGTWSFQSLDLYKYPIGTYTLTIQGVTGINSFQTTTSTFELTLVNPCLGAELFLKDPQPLTNMLYTVRDASKVQ